LSLNPIDLIHDSLPVQQLGALLIMVKEPDSIRGLLLDRKEQRSKQASQCPRADDNNTHGQKNKRPSLKNSVTLSIVFTAPQGGHKNEYKQKNYC
jgi:hypothetical protein